MAPSPARSRHSGSCRNILAGLGIVAAAALLLLQVSSLFAQGSPMITSVDPTSGKVSDTITASGQNLAKPRVAAVFLSDKKNDYKATVVEETDDKIVLKVPQVAPGDYNISIQVGNAIFIQPVRFTVAQ